MFKIGDIVKHVDYPAEKGRVVAKCKQGTLGVVLVKWDERGCSRHIPQALTKVK